MHILHNYVVYCLTAIRSRLNPFNVKHKLFVHDNYSVVEAEISGYILEEPSWHTYPKNQRNFLNVGINTSRILWPWSGWMAVYIAVNKTGCDYEGIVRGYIKLVVQCPNELDSIVVFPITAKIIPKPPRHKRVLWDQFHNLQYPPGYLPRDNLKIKTDPLDWKGDHIHTNFREMYNHLRNSGYYIDVLRGPYNCFDATEYGTILIVDPEEEYFIEEIIKLKDDVYNNDLSIIVFADWYNTTVMKNIKFFDENTRQWWIPDTGGANIPALNELLEPFGIAFGDFIGEGYFSLGEHSMYYGSGSIITKFPETSGGILIGAYLHDQGLQILSNNEYRNKSKHLLPILGLLHAEDIKTNYDNTNSVLIESNYEDNTIHKLNINAEQIVEHNPVLQKRILLQNIFQDTEHSNTIKSNKDTSSKQQLYSSEINENMNYMNQLPSKGRIAIFGDSNCLDSTNLEKPCFWLLDALLEFTMNSHVSSVFENVNKEQDIKLVKNQRLPLRLLTNKLNVYSKVLDSENMFKRKALEECEQVMWASDGNDPDLEFILRENLINRNYEYYKNFPRNLDRYKEGIGVSSNLSKHAMNDPKNTPKDTWVKNDRTLIFTYESLNSSLLKIMAFMFVVIILLIMRFNPRRHMQLCLRNIFS